MRWLETIRHVFFPRLSLQATPWVSLWEARERQVVTLASRVTLPLACLVLVAHYLFVDMPLGLQPARNWMAFRFGTAGLATCMFLATLLKGYETARFFRMPLALSGVGLSVMQAVSMTWWNGVPYFYTIAIPCIMCLIMQDSPSRSALYLVGIFAVQWPFLMQSGQDARLILSAESVGLIGVVGLRMRMLADIRAFLLQQEHLADQKKIIEQQMAMNAAIQAFLPREIYRRLLDRQQRHRLTTLQAMDDVLKPEIRTIACLYSDIRGFTHKSKDLKGFTANSALPNIQQCTDLVETHRGISRLIGDLVFAYFDDSVPTENISHALKCAFALVDANEQWNKSVSDENAVRRFVLLSFGDAVVGNIGGHDGAREITALGSCVNVLARIDSLTKDQALVQHLDYKNVILTEAAARSAQSVFPELQMSRLDLTELGVSIRDFSEETGLWLIEVDPQHAAALGE